LGQARTALLRLSCAVRAWPNTVGPASPRTLGLTMHRTLLLLAALASGFASATTQAPDEMKEERGVAPVLGSPIEELASAEPSVKARLANTFCQNYNSGLQRGYVGTWEISEGRLWLVGLRGMIKPCGSDSNFGNLKEIALEELFSPQAGKVHASWYTGPLWIGRGGLLKCKHPSFAIPFRRFERLYIREGKVLGTASEPGSCPKPPRVSSSSQNST
jgi:hypothetical protein